MNTEIKITETKDHVLVILFNRTASKYKLAFVLLFAIVGFLVPIVATLLSLDTITISVTISFVIFWSISFYLLKLFLWNKYGREVIKIFNDRVEYFCDYKLFKLGSKTLSTNIKFSFLDENKKPIRLDALDNVDKNAHILFKEDGNVVITHFSFFISHIKSYLPLIKKHCSYDEG